MTQQLITVTLEKSHNAPAWKASIPIPLVLSSVLLQLSIKSLILENSYFRRIGHYYAH